MSLDYGALCSDYYVNQRVVLRMDLPGDRGTLLGLFDRVKKEWPAMASLRRFRGEVALESDEEVDPYIWFALRRTSIRSGIVNPESPQAAMAFHASLLKVAPYYLTISPLDVAMMEVVFGFDIETDRDRNEVVFDALLGESSLAGIIDRERDRLGACQPALVLTLGGKGDLQAIIRVQTRVKPGEAKSGEFEMAPITVTCAVRRRGSIDAVDDLPRHFERLVRRGAELVTDRLIPRVLQPIRDAILSRPE
ncbi:MAG: hypothetical protein HRU76_03045 [Phycisphaeraceae bacterium]|nr:MAG: hypothetical protein HRU76_03045 [Phycisphaeraceae bacterium]